MTDELVAIAYEFSPLKANLIRSRLEADGIECFLAGETLTSVVGSFSHAAASWEHPEGNVAIQVRVSDAEVARAILQDLQSPVVEDGGDEEWLATGPSPALIFFRLLIIIWMSFAATALTAGAFNSWWLGSIVGVGVLIGLSLLAFKKNFKSER
jgi:hypothetical protein